MATRTVPATVPCKYRTGKVLGQGTYATVKEAVHIDTGMFYACKIINKKLMEGREDMIKNEIAVLRSISEGHKNILNMVDYFETMNNLYLITELALGGELFDRICQKGSYFEKDAAHVIRTVTDAVAYLHSHGIVHRDLKPENLLFRTKDEDSDLLIADFGLSRIIDSAKLHVLMTTCGTPGYMAPEIFKKTGHSMPVDMWAIGVITYFLLCGYTPFDRESTVDEMNAIMNADYSFDDQIWLGISADAKDFIKQMLTIDSLKRPTAQQALAHHWFATFEVPAEDTVDLLPGVRRNFNARRTLKKAIDVVKLSVRLNNYRSGSLRNEEKVAPEHIVEEEFDNVLGVDNGSQ